MNIQIEQSILSKHLDNAAKFLPKKDVIPILSHIILTASSSYGLEIVAGNSETFLKPVISSENVKIIENGSAAIPGKELTEIVKKLTGLITIETRTSEVVLRTDKSEYELDVLDPDEYPPFPVVNESPIRMKGKDFKELIATTTYATSTNEATPILTGTLFTLREGVLRIVSTDRHRLARIDSEGEGDGFQTVVSGSVLTDLAKILSDDEIAVSFQNALIVKTDDFTFYSRILDGSYPETERMIPISFSSIFAVNKRDLSDALDRVLIVAKETKSNLVKLKLDQSEMVIESKEQKKRAKEKVDVKSSTGKQTIMNCNGRYLSDALKAIGSSDIEICMNAQTEPFIIRGKDELAFHLILPYRTTS